MKKARRLLVVLLCCALTLGLVPMAAAAAEPIAAVSLSVSGYGIGQPMADANITTTTQGVTVTAVGGWLDAQYNEVAGNFERGKLYCHYVTLQAEDGYALPALTDDNIKSIITVNGKAPAYAWVMGTETDGSIKILFFMEALSEKVDALSLTVNNLAVGNTWAESNVTTTSEKVFIQNAKLIYKGVVSDHDILVTDPLQAHTPYQLYLYIWTNNGYSFDIGSLQKENIEVVVNGQTVMPVAVRDGGDNGRSIVMDVDMPLLHNYGAYQYDENQHWQECQDADCPDKEGSIRYSTASHSFGDWTEVKAPTETEQGSKERACVCGYKETAAIPVTGHVETEVINAKEATCTEEGYTGDKVCKGCGKVLEKGTVIEKLPHNYVDGKCSVCGAVDPSVKPAEATPTPAVETTDGAATETATPKTGEPNVMIVWAALLVLSGLGIAGTVMYGRKKAAK
ncbi:Uncharacterised protein [uncultured Clostridium sp.]|nr:Uncharacterised protein [uncultured Clostridium sp.]